jgi:myo-inositol 2-dehydrogenase/D-chiro-inositol 1-dehydrogenase
MWADHLFATEIFLASTTMIRLAVVGPNPSAPISIFDPGRLLRATCVAVAHPDLAGARETATALGTRVTVASWDQLVQHHAEGFDAVLIQAPLESRADLVLQAAAAGKHVLVEGPLAASTDLANQAITACETAAVHLMVGHEMRFLPSNMAVAQALKSGRLGEPALLRIHHWLPADTTATFPQDPTGDAYRAVTIGHLAGEIDLANWLFQGLPTRVYGKARCSSTVQSDSPSGTQMKDRDYFQLHLAYPCDGMALIDRSTALPAGADYFSLSLIGTTGAAYADDHNNMHLAYRGGPPTAIRGVQGDGHLLTQVQEFVDAIHEDRDPVVTGRDGQAAIRVAETAIESMMNGRPVLLD